ncbi:MAG TPA: transporter substrate-binding domain-containing protein, partial [Candidatus Fimenecus stercoravium]|nr:transporter substrate-binding domain-containing protein [Candidatus Fimenecus stercoravium]
MKTVTKVLSVLLALALVVGCFAACGSDTAGDTTTAPASGSASALVKVIDVELTEEYYAFGVDKNQPELLEQVNAFIAEIKANGQLEEIFN